ncbi:hypothetical protein BC937DRAFT_86470 [Endogone sp. FLAS-F59071]|nr:hypothetical protein BC937DRAFT_86470 [Endogone sp. FLAS-F59071]|eukprot:RUS22833.1 hypothetical protein BC937DRAFT_86470 [Endogone sp. FLAS-F59071]
MFADSRHNALHALCVRIVHSLDLLSDVVPTTTGTVPIEQESAVEQGGKDGEPGLLAAMAARGDGTVVEMRRRAWWHGYYNVDCCKLIPHGAADDDDGDAIRFATLQLPRPLPDECEADASGALHLAAKCGLRAIQRRVARAVGNGAVVPAGEVRAIEGMLARWREGLPDQMRLNEVTGTAAAPAMSSWTFFLATELEMKYQSTMVVLHRLFVREEEPGDVEEEVSPRRSLAVCVRAYGAVVSLLRARQVYGFCRSNVHTFMEVCDTLLDVMGLARDDDIAGEARQTLGAALRLMRNTRAYREGTYDKGNHARVLEEAWKRFEVKPAEDWELDRWGVWYKPDVSGEMTP